MYPFKKAEAKAWWYTPAIPAMHRKCKEVDHLLQAKT
jgi:hypothetical protein